MTLNEQEREFLGGFCRRLDKIYYVAQSHDRDARRAGAATMQSAVKIKKIRDSWWSLRERTESGTVIFKDVVERINGFIGEPGSISDMEVCQRETNQIQPFLLQCIIEMPIEDCFEAVVWKLKTWGELHGKVGEQYNKIASALESKKLKETFSVDVMATSNKNNVNAL
jgi:hypothetical protein